MSTTKLGLTATAENNSKVFSGKVSWQPRYYIYVPASVTDVYVELPTATSDYKVKLAVPS